MSKKTPNPPPPKNVRPPPPPSPPPPGRRGLTEGKTKSCIKRPPKSERPRPTRSSPTSLSELQKEIGIWSDAAFGPGPERRDGMLSHLRKEINELCESPDDIMEYADCLMLLLDAARVSKISIRDLTKAVSIKLEINKVRSWGPVNADGSIEHIKKET